MTESRIGDGAAIGDDADDSDDEAPTRTLLEQMGGKAVTQAVRSCFRRKFCIGYSTAHHLLQCTDC